MSQKEYMRERRKKAKDAGMCPQHIYEKIVEGMSSCQVCVDKQQQTYLDRKTANVCQRHPSQTVSAGSVLCDECLKNNAAQGRKRVLEGKLNGMCIHHASRKAEMGLCCEECWFRDMSFKSLDTSIYWKEIRNLLVSQNFLCAYTGAKLIPGDNASIDHITPCSKGGLRELANLQWVTDVVNDSKRDVMPDRFLQIIYQVAQRFNLDVN